MKAAVLSSTKIAEDMLEACSRAVEEVLAAAPEREIIEEPVTREPAQLKVAVDLEEDEEVPEYEEGGASNIHFKRRS